MPFLSTKKDEEKYRLPEGLTLDDLGSVFEKEQQALPQIPDRRSMGREEGLPQLPEGLTLEDLGVVFEGETRKPQTEYHPLGAAKQSMWQGIRAIGSGVPGTIGRIIPGEDTFEKVSKENKAFYDKIIGDDPDIRKYVESVQKGSEGFATEVLGNLGPTAAALGTAFVTRAGPVFSTAMFYDLNTEEIEDLARQKGADEETAKRVGMVGGIINTALDMTGIGRMMKVFKPARKLTNFLIGLGLTSGIEGGTEGIQGVVGEIASEWAAKPKDETQEQFAERMWAKKDELQKTFLHDASIGAAIGGGVHTVGAGVGQAIGEPSQPSFARDLDTSGRQKFQGFFGEAGEKLGLQPTQTMRDRTAALDAIREGLRQNKFTFEQISSMGGTPEAAQLGITQDDLNAIIVDHQSSKLDEVMSGRSGGMVETLAEGIAPSEGPRESLTVEPTPTPRVEPTAMGRLRGALYGKKGRLVEERATGDLIQLAESNLDDKGNWTLPGDTLRKELEERSDNEIVGLMNWAKGQSRHVDRNVSGEAAAILRERGVPVDTVEWQFENLPDAGKKARFVEGEEEAAPVSRETIPEFKDTEQALAFGKTATPAQKELLTKRRAEGVKRTEELMEADDLNAAMIEGTKAQFDREALEAGKEPAEETGAIQVPEGKNIPSKPVGVPGSLLGVSGTLAGATPIETPNGRWIFAGKVPAELSYERIDGKPITDEDVKNIKQFGPGLFKETIKSVSWASKEEALAAAKRLSEGKVVEAGKEPAEAKKELDVFYIKKPDGKKVEVIKNPTSTELRQLSTEFRKEFPDAKGEPYSRSTYDAEGNEYVWRSDIATHDMVESEIKKKLWVDVNQNKHMLEAAAPAEAKGKEPWELSEDEIKTAFKNPLGDDSYRKPWMMPVDYWNGYQAAVFGDTPKAPDQRTKEWHRGQILNALHEGKPVPASVLADYPDLAPKAPVDTRLTEKKEQLEKKLERLNSEVARRDETDMPGTYVTGASGVPGSRIRKLDRQLDKRIDLATKIIETKNELTSINAKIAGQENAPKTQAVKEGVRSRLQEQFDSIEVGDKVDVGGNEPLTVIKKNKRTVVTEGGSKWSADEIAKVVKATGKEPVAETPEAEKPTAIGTAWVKNQWKPITDSREITKGKNKGKFRVTLADGKKRTVETVRMGEAPEPLTREQKLSKIQQEAEAKNRERANKAKSFRMWVKYAGGIQRKDKTWAGEIRDIIGRKGMRGMPPGLFKRTALGIDEMTLKAIEAGWLPKGATEDDFMRALEENPRQKVSDIGSEEWVDKQWEEEIQLQADKERDAGESEDDIRRAIESGTSEEIERIEAEISRLEKKDEYKDGDSDGLDIWFTKEQQSLFGKPEPKGFELTPEELTKKERLAKAQDEAKRKGLQKKGERPVFEHDKGIKPAIIGKQGSLFGPGAEQQDIFTNARGEIEPEFKPAPPPGGGPIRTRQRTRMVWTGRTVKSASWTVRNRSDVAALLSKFRKHKQENLFIVSTDKNNKIIELFLYSKGSKASSVYKPSEISGHILNMPEATRVYVVHNHPSGQAKSSKQDQVLIRVITKEAKMREAPVDIQALVIAGTKWVAFNETGDTEPIQPIRPTLKKAEIQIEEGLTVKKRDYASSLTVTSASVARQIIDGEYGGKEGFLLLDQGGKDIGFLEFTPGRPMFETTRDLISIFEKANVSSIVFNSKKPIEQHDNRGKFIKDLIREFEGDVTVMDILTPDISFRDNLIYKRPETSGELSLFGAPIHITQDIVGRHVYSGSDIAMFQLGAEARNTPIKKGDIIKFYNPNPEGFQNKINNKTGKVIRRFDKGRWEIRLDDFPYGSPTAGHVLEEDYLTVVSKGEKYKRPKPQENKKAVAEWIDKYGSEHDVELQEGGERYYRVVWDNISHPLEANTLSEVGLADNDTESQGLYAIHVTSDPDFWAEKLQEDYDRGGDYKIVEIEAMEGDVLTDDPQYAIPEENGFMADSRILVTSRPQFMRDKQAKGQRVFYSMAERNAYRQSTIPEGATLGVSADRLNRLAARIRRTWKNAPPITIVEKQTELPEAITRQQEGKIISGVYHNGQVYLVAENMVSPEFAQKTVAHEVFGHHGFKVLRDIPGIKVRMDRFLDRLYRTQKEAIDRIGERYGYDTGTKDGTLLASEEWLARTAETNPRDTWVRRAVALIRQWLAKVFPGLKVANSEIAAWVGQMRKAVEGGEAAWDQPTLDRIALLERNGEKLDAIREAETARFALTEPQQPATTEPMTEKGEGRIPTVSPEAEGGTAKKKLFQGYGAELKGNKVILYRGGDVSKSELKKLRYGDYLSASKEGPDITGNEGAASYGKNVIRLELPIADIEVTGAGEFQYKGKAESLEGGRKYPEAIYRAYNDYHGSNFTAEEIDKETDVRQVASMALEGGREEFDALMENSLPNPSRSPSVATEAEGGAIKSIVDTMNGHDEWYDWGLRVIPGDYKAPKIGDVLDASNEWVEGEWTESALAGTATIGIKNAEDKNVLQAIKDVLRNNYFGDTVVLVKGDGVGYGQDPGERIIKDAEVVAIFNKSDLPNPSRSPSVGEQPRFSAQTPEEYAREFLKTFITSQPKGKTPPTQQPTKKQKDPDGLFRSGRNAIKNRFGKGYVDRDMKWFHKAFGLPYWQGKKFKEMGDHVRVEIDAMEKRSEELFRDYEGPLGQVQEEMGKDKKSLAGLRDLIWKWDGKRLPKSAVPSDWVKDPDAEDLEVNPEHYEQMRAYLKKQGIADKVANAYVTIRQKLDEKWIDIDRTLRVEKLDPELIEQFRSQINKIHNYFPHRRTGGSHVTIIKKAEEGKDKQVVFREHYNTTKDRLVSDKNKADSRARAWLREQLKTGELQGTEADYHIYQGAVKQLPDEVFFQIPVENMQQIVAEAGRQLETYRAEYESQRLYNKEGKLPGEALELAKKRLHADMEVALSKAVAEVFKGRGWGRHAILRKGIPGHETEDVFGILFDYLSGYAGFKTKMERARKHHDILVGINAKKNPQLYSYCSNYVRDMLANQDKIDRAVDTARGLLFVKYLGFVPKSGMINLTQNVVLAAPILGTHTKHAHIKLGKAMKDVRRGLTSTQAWTGKEVKYPGLTADEQKALHEMIESGASMDLYLRELKGSIPGTGMVRHARKFIDKAGIFMQIAEKFNRASTGLAAYRVAVKEKGMEYDAAVEFAKQVIYDSHFLYGQPNLPSAMRGGSFRKGIRAAYTFRSFTHNYIQAISHLLANQEYAAVARSLRNIMIVGGLTSLPFFKILSEALYWAMGDDDEDPLTDIRGKLPYNWMKDLVTYGLPGVAGADFSGSLSIEAPTSWKDLIGVPYSALEDSVNMVESLKSGQRFRAVSESPITPLFVRNAMRSVELSTEGQRTRGGRDINYPGVEGPKKISGIEAIAKGVLGIQPTEVSKGYRSYTAIAGMEESIQRKKTKLADRYVNAMRRDDSDEMEAIVREVVEWNQRAVEEDKTYRLIDLKQSIRNRLRTGGLTGIPKTMRREALNIADQWRSAVNE